MFIQRINTVTKNPISSFPPPSGALKLPCRPPPPSAPRPRFGPRDSRFNHQPFSLTFLIRNELPACISSLSGRISRDWSHPSNQKKSLSANLIAISSGLCRVVPLFFPFFFTLMQNDRPLCCFLPGTLNEGKRCGHVAWIAFHSM